MIQRVRKETVIYRRSARIKIPACAKSISIKNEGGAPALLWGCITLLNTDAPIVLPCYDTNSVQTERADEIDLVYIPNDEFSVIVEIDIALR